MKNLLTTVVAGMVILLAAAAPICRAGLIYDNLSQASGGSDFVGQGGLVDGPLYGSFSTGAGAGVRLTGVQLLLSNGGGSSGITSIGIFNSNNGTSPPSPGTLYAAIGTVSESSLSATASVWNVSLVSPLSLAANTRYWVGLSTNNGAVMQWWYSSNSAGTGVTGEYFSNNNGTFQNVGDGPYQMSVSVTAVPEPTTSAMALAGLAYGCYSLVRHRKRA
jgi:hypothetical protein